MAESADCWCQMMLLVKPTTTSPTPPPPSSKENKIFRTAPLSEDVQNILRTSLLDKDMNVLTEALTMKSKNVPALSPSVWTIEGLNPTPAKRKKKVHFMTPTASVETTTTPSPGVPGHQTAPIEDSISATQTQPPATTTKLLPCRLNNLGCSCYANATLQYLFTADAFCKQLSNLVKKTPKNLQHPFVKSFVQLSKLRLDSKAKDMQTNLLLLVLIYRVAKLNMQFSIVEENDAHDFLCCCLNQIEEFGQKVGWKEDPSKCPLTSNFKFQMSNTMTCSSCGFQRSRVEMVSHLSVPLVHNSVEQCLQDITNTSEEIELNCTECGAGVASSRWTFDSLPRYLILQLNRFKMSDDSVIKLLTPVDIEPELQITCPSHSDTPRTENIREEDSETDRSEVSKSTLGYRLISVLSRLGNLPYKGHYVSDCYSHDTCQWLTYDDNVKVTVTTEEDVIRQRSFDAYVLLYEAVEVPRPEAETDSDEVPSDVSLSEEQAVVEKMMMDIVRKVLMKSGEKRKESAKSYSQMTLKDKIKSLFATRPVETTDSLITPLPETKTRCLFSTTSSNKKKRHCLISCSRRGKKRQVSTSIPNSGLPEKVTEAQTSAASEGTSNVPPPALYKRHTSTSASVSSEETMFFTAGFDMFPGGLHSFGMNCYVGEFLQCLLTAKAFCRELSDLVNSYDHTEDQFIRYLRDLAMLRINLKGRFVNKNAPLLGLSYLVEVKNPDFNREKQNDANYFLCFCLNQIEESCLRLAWKNNAEPKCPVSSNFTFQMNNTVTCSSCGSHENSKVQNFSHLSLTLVHNTVKECIKYITDTVSEVEFNCSKCGVLFANSGWTFRTPPRYLIVHLDRFDITEDDVIVKLLIPIDIEPELQITCYPHSDTPRTENIKAEDIETDRNEVGVSVSTYRLISVLSHYGSTPFKGHYVSDCHIPKNNKWITHHDSRTFPTTLAKVIQKRSTNACMLLYEKVSTKPYRPRKKYAKWWS